MSGHCKRCGHDGCVCDENQTDTNMSETPTPREKFEEWAAKDGYMLQRAEYGDDIYKSANTRFAWEAWREASKELTAVTEQLREARRLAEKYRNLSCEDQDQADETLLPWETKPTREI